MTNPYEAPRNIEPHDVANRKTRRWLNIWLFAICWPFVSTFLHKIALSLSPLLIGAGLPPAFIVLVTSSPALFGYLVCIVAAARYPATKSKRAIRGIGAVMLMLVWGNISKIALMAMASRMR